MQAYDANPLALDRSPASWSRMKGLLTLSLDPNHKRTKTRTKTRTRNPNGRAHSQVASVTNVSSSLARRGLSASKNQ